MTPNQSGAVAQIQYLPLTPERWNDLESLFGPRGACGGCWCMWWRLKRSEFDRQRGPGNRHGFHAIVEAGDPPGLLAYIMDETNHTRKPVAWCSLGPREAFPVLGRSPVLKPVDNQPVWSLVCFFVAKPYRRMGLTLGLIEAAKSYAMDHQAKILEAYPEDPEKASVPEVFAFTGFASTFRSAGFEEVARRSPHRPIMRCVLEAG